MPIIRNQEDWKHVFGTTVQTACDEINNNKVQLTQVLFLSIILRYPAWIFPCSASLHFLWPSFYAMFIWWVYSSCTFRSFSGYRLLTVICCQSDIVGWAGHCVRGCCIRAKVAHFKICLFYSKSDEDITYTYKWKVLNIGPDNRSEWQSDIIFTLIKV